MRRLRTAAVLALMYGALIGAWWLFAYAKRGPASPYVEPVQLVQAVWHNRKVLWPNFTATAHEAALGFLVGAAIAIVLSLVTVRFQRLGNLIGRFSLILYSLPLIAIAPLLVIWFGAGLLTKVIIAALAAFFPVLVNATAALTATDAKALELMNVMGASYSVTSLRVRIPYALPSTFASFSIAAPAAIIGATVAEWVGGDRGLGVAILASMQSYNIVLLWSCIFVVSLLSLASYAIFAFAGRWLFPWHESTQASGVQS